MGVNYPHSGILPNTNYVEDLVLVPNYELVKCNRLVAVQHDLFKHDNVGVIRIEVGVGFKLEDHSHYPV